MERQEATRARLKSSEGGAAQLALEIDQVSMIYGRETANQVVALQSASLRICEGEFVSVVGPSGCGKSTLLKLIIGLLSPTQGRIRVGRHETEREPGSVGIVFQAPVLLPWRTIAENVLLPAKILGMPTDQAKKSAADLLEMVGLAGFEDRYPNELSGGMQQRASIARSLIYDPAILLMDEPFGALDALTREQMNLELQRIWSESGKTVLFVTHSISEAVFLSDRVVVLSPRPGRVAAVLPVGLPRPRTLDDMASSDFGTLCRDLRAHLDTEGREQQ